MAELKLTGVVIPDFFLWVEKLQNKASGQSDIKFYEIACKIFAKTWQNDKSLNVNLLNDNSPIIIATKNNIQFNNNWRHLLWIMWLWLTIYVYWHKVWGNCLQLEWHQLYFREFKMIYYRSYTRKTILFWQT